MDIGKYRNSQWLKKSDVEAMPAEQRATTVDRVAEETVGEDSKPVLYLTGIKKGWPANITALESLAEMAGSMDTDDFAGLPVEIFVDPDVRYAGKRVGGIKLRKPQSETMASVDFQAPPPSDADIEAQAQQAESQQADLDDPITF